ncbi:hypothetical protein ES703_73195 [subsurface metagenome]
MRSSTVPRSAVTVEASSLEVDLTLKTPESSTTAAALLPFFRTLFRAILPVPALVEPFVPRLLTEKIQSSLLTLMIGMG